MPKHTHRTAVLLIPLVLLTACGGAQERRTARLLNHRLHDRLAADIAANNVALQSTPGGARVTFLDLSAEPGGPLASARPTTSARASLIEGLLDPALMRVSLDDTSTLPSDQKARRVANLTQYFQANALGDIVTPPSSSDAPAAAPPGATVTIRVQCPHRNDGTGYDSGKRKPDCF